MSEKISQSETTTPRARRTRVKKINASYTRVYGSHSAFDLIELLPARTIGNISSIARQDVDRELTTDYLRETLHQSLGVQLQEGLAIEIRMRCRAGIEEIVRANIHETRRGTSQDNRLGSLKTSLVRLEQALMGLTKA